VIRINDVLDKLRSSVKLDKDKAGLIAGTESVDQMMMPVVDEARSTLLADIDFALDSLSTGNEEIVFTDAQKEAAKKVALLAVDPLATLKKYTTKGREDIDVAGESMTIDTRNFMDEFIPDQELMAGIESFDGQDVSSSLFFSIVYNTLSIKQDAVSELFYPIVVIDPNKMGATVTAKITNIMQAVKRDVTGRPVDFKKQSIVKQLNNTELFTLDANRLYPVYSTDTADKLVDEAGAKREVTVGDGIKITTAPIKAGTAVDLLGIAQNDELLSKGYMDETDALSGHLAIEALYFHVKGKDAGDNEITELHKKEITGLPAVFTYTPTGHHKDLQLDYKTDSLAWVGGNVTKADGTPTQIVDLANLPQGYTVKLRINLKGDSNTQTAKTLVNMFEMEMVGLLDANGNAVSETDELYTKVKAIFDATTFAGYDIEAFATNSNARFRGKLLTTDVYTTVYTIPVRTKVREVTAVFQNGDDGDVAGLIGQIEFNKRALSKFGLLELNNTAAVLENLSEDTEAYGISSKLVNKAFSRETVDLTTIVDSLKSGERVEDIKEALKLKIRNTAIDLYVRSNYNLAFETIYPNVKPTVIIGVDTNIGRFVESFEDEVFNYKVAVSNDTLINGKIFMSFGIMGANRNKVADPLNFGVCFWSPEVVLTLQRQENGTIKQESISMPRFKHQTLMPILGMLEVTGVEEVSGKLPQDIHTV